MLSVEGAESHAEAVLAGGCSSYLNADTDAVNVALTFLEQFTDVRELQRRLKAQGVALAAEADESTTGPAHFMAIDPDGNPILVDQHR